MPDGGVISFSSSSDCYAILASLKRHCQPVTLALRIFHFIPIFSRLTVDSHIANINLLFTSNLGILIEGAARAPCRAVHSAQDV